MVSSPTTALQDVEAGDLVFRICGSARDGQIVRLRSGKCTIGSGPRCTLRLRARGVRPLHCLIVRGDRATVVRRWAPDTRLNGHAFSDAELTPGDRLAVGPIEFEVLDLAPVAEQPHGQIPPSRDPELKAGPAYRRQLEVLKRRLASANRQGRGRARRLIQQLRAARRRIQQLQDPQEPTGPEQSEQLTGGVTELGARQQDFEDQRRRWEAERADTRQRLSERAEQLDARQEELETLQRVLEEERRRRDAERADAERRLNQQAEDLETRQRQLDAQLEALQHQRDQWEVERIETERQLNARAKELDAPEAGLDTRPSMAKGPDEPGGIELPSEDSGREDLPSQANQPEEIQSPDLSTASPASSEEIFRRLYAGALAPDDEVEEHEQPPVEPEPSRHETVEISPPSSEPPGDDDESIDDYMARLLDRVRSVTGGSNQPSVSFCPAPVRDSAPATEPAAHGATSQPTTPEQTKAKRRGLVEISPRAVAPEKVAGLSAMRELANLSAHNAIDRHTRRTLVYLGHGKLLVVTVGLAVGGGLVWLWWRGVSSGLVVYAALVSFLTALFWGLQYALLAGRAIFGKSRQPVGKLENVDAGGDQKRKLATGHQPPVEQNGEQSSLTSGDSPITGRTMATDLADNQGA